MAGFVCAVTLFGCEADTNELGGQADVGTADATGARDGGSPADDGGADASFAADAEVPPDGGARTCQDPGSYGVRLVGVDEPGLSGVVRLERFGEDWRLVDGPGQREIRLSGALPADLFAERTYYLRLEVFSPFWIEQRLTLYYLDGDGNPGAVAWIAYKGQYRELREQDVAYRHEPEGCVVDDRCGVSEGMRLVAEVAGEQSRAGRGQNVPAAGYEIFNGRSARYVEGPSCEDTPSAWYDGWVFAARRALPPCAALPRDACIADPRCVLWGSEQLDPGYVCVDAVGDCEPIASPDLCRATVSCSWSPGACYCPEGAVCACGGGPAPKCQSLCGGLVGFMCPSGRACEDQSLLPPGCERVPDGGGVCLRTPDDCAGTPEIPVCGCALGGPRLFANDCVRRQSGAPQVSREACGQ